MMRGRSGERFALINKQITGRPDDRLQIRLASGLPACAASDVALGSTPGATSLEGTLWEKGMSWKTPKIVEVSVGMEINMYMCATRN